MRKFLSLIVLVGFGVLNTGCNSFNVAKLNPNPNINLSSNERKESLSLDLDPGINDAPHIENAAFTASVSEFRKSLENGFNNGFKDYFRVEPSKSASDLTIKLTRADLDISIVSHVGFIATITYRATLNKKNGEIIKRTAATAKSKKLIMDCSAVTKDAIESMYELIANDFFPAK